MTDCIKQYQTTTAHFNSQSDINVHMQPLARLESQIYLYTLNRIESRVKQTKMVWTHKTLKIRNCELFLLVIFLFSYEQKGTTGSSMWKVYS